MTTNYDRNIFRQLEDVLKKCDSLSQEITSIKREHKKEVEQLNDKLKILEKENSELKKKNEKLTNEVDRLKKQCIGVKIDFGHESVENVI